MAAKNQPVFGICGYSGSGKTTLIESLIPRLRRDGLAVAVVKHDAHGMRIDTEGKDTDRFFCAGATVFAHDPQQGFLRVPAQGDTMLDHALSLLLRDHDLVLVEGHKQTALPEKIWLQSEDGGAPPPETVSIQAVFEWQTDRVEAVYQLIQTRLSALFLQRAVYGGILVGGRSSRMGKQKQMIEMDGMSWSERGAEVLLPHVRELCILGAGPLPEPLNRYPRLPDAPGFEGPAGGLVSAMRWQPHGSWIFAACDMPLITPEAIEWLLAQRRPGCWGVVPVNQAGVPEPLFAWYDPRLLPALEHAGYPIALVDHPKVRTLSVPADVSTAWRNFNTPKDLQGNGPAASTVE